MADVVYSFSKVTWQVAWRRGSFMSEDRLAHSLIANDRIERLLICNPARNGAIKLVRHVTGGERAPFPAEDRINLVEPLSLRRGDPTSVGAVERAYAAYDRALARAVRRHGLRDPYVITGNPLMAGFAELPWARGVTWYAIDDWAEHPAYGRWSDVYRESYRRVRDRKRRVAAVSEGLLNRLDPGGPSVVVSNGLDPDEWRGAFSAPEWLAGLRRPLFVYVGALDSRIDVDWMRALALTEPAATVLLVGPLMASDHLRPLQDLANVRFGPELDHARICGLLRAADVGLLPHRVTRLTTAMSPLKLLEYLAAGLPVVATDLGPVRALGHPRVRLVPEGGDFAATARSALALGPAAEQERLDFLAANSWRSRHERLLDLALAA